MAEKKSRIHYVSRGIGVLGCTFPFALQLASIIVGLECGGTHGMLGVSVMVVASLVGGLNFFLSFIRPWLHRRRHGSLEDQRHVSGLPVVGTMLVVCAVVFNFGSIPCAVAGLVTIAIDTGGSLWLLIATWRDSSLWQA